MAKRYGSTYALKMDELIEDIGTKLAEGGDEEASLIDESDTTASYADKIRAVIPATGAAAYPHLVLKKMVEDAKGQSSSTTAQEDATDGKRYGSTTAKRLDDWITLTASKLKSDSAQAEAPIGEADPEAEARERQQAHAYGTTEYQRRVWFDMVENAGETSNVEQEQAAAQEVV